MVKGVNKQIIEVNNPDSIYFERAVFYLKPGVRILPTELSEREINKIIAPYSENRKNASHMKIGRFIICFMLILTAAVISYFLIF